MIKLKHLILEFEGEQRFDGFMKSLEKYGLEYHAPSESQHALQWHNSIYPTITNKDKSVKLALDRTDIFDRNGDVWVGDASHPLIDARVLAAIVTAPEHRRKGLAKEVMKNVIKAADENDIQLKLEPAPIKSFTPKGYKGPSRDQLIKWYKKLGFIPNERGNIMTREPKP